MSSDQEKSGQLILLTRGDGGALLVDGSVELVVLALQLVDFFVELGLEIGGLQLKLLQALEPLLHGRRQGLKQITRTVKGSFFKD